MADKTYAWSNIVYGAEKDDDGNVLGQKVIAAGEAVSQGDIGVDDDEWQMLQDQQVVREYALPEDLQDTYRSPTQLMQDKLVAAQQGFDVSGPTADLVKRFDDEGNVMTQEELDKASGTTAPAPAKAANAASNA